jgi:hypothetical protein
MQRGSTLAKARSTGVPRSAEVPRSTRVPRSTGETRSTGVPRSLAKVLRDTTKAEGASAGVEVSHERGTPVASAGVEAAGPREGELGERYEDAGYRGTSLWGEKHGLSTEQFPVSAYAGSSKNLKDPKGERYKEASSLYEEARRSADILAAALERMRATGHSPGDGTG